MSDFFQKMVAKVAADQQAAQPAPAPAPAPAPTVDNWLAQKQKVYERAGARPEQIAQWQERNRAKYEEIKRQQQEAQTQAALPPAVLSWMFNQGR